MLSSVDEDGAGDLRDDAVLEGQHRRRPLVGACLAEVRRAGNVHRIEERLARRGAGDEARHRDRVAADIEDAAAGEVVGEEPVLGHEARHLEAEARLDHPHLADRAGRDQLAELRRLRMQAIHERLAGEGAGLPVRVEDRVDLEGGERHRLLDQDMLAGLRRLDRPFGVARMRRRDVDRLDLRIVEQRLVAVEDARAGERLGEARLLRVARVPIATSFPVRRAFSPRWKS